MTATPELDTKRIIGTFHAQAEDGNDRLIALGSYAFDATIAILQMELKSLRALRDYDQTSDEIGRGAFNPEGPFDVELVDAVTGFFGVSCVSEITAEQLSDARAKYGLSGDDTRWGRGRVTLTFEAPAGLAERITAECARQIDVHADALGGINHAVVCDEPGMIERPCNAVRCDSDDVFSIPEPEAANGTRGRVSVVGQHSGLDMAALMRRQLDAADKVAPSVNQPLVLQPEVTALASLGTTARVCARDKLGWYAIDHVQVDWASTVACLSESVSDTRVWAVTTASRGDRVRVALMLINSDAPLVYELTLDEQSNKAPDALFDHAGPPFTQEYANESEWLLKQHYCKECDVNWEDEWFCETDDECPQCGKEIGPTSSKVILVNPHAG